jgi:ATP-dependent Clp protease ATP-binding subunit ClpA
VPSFSNTLEQAIHAALALANARRHELATLEHLLLALIDEPDAAKVMRACNVDLDELRKTLVEVHRRGPRHARHRHRGLRGGADGRPSSG